GGRAEHLVDVPALVQWDDRATDRVVRRVQRDREVHRQIQRGQLIHLRDDADRRDRHAARADAEELRVDEHPHRRDRRVEVRERLPHPHRDDMRHALAACDKLALPVTHLIDDLADREVARPVDGLLPIAQPGDERSLVDIADRWKRGLHLTSVPVGDVCGHRAGNLWGRLHVQEACATCLCACLSYSLSSSRSHAPRYPRAPPRPKRRLGLRSRWASRSHLRCSLRTELRFVVSPANEVRAEDPATGAVRWTLGAPFLAGAATLHWRLLLTPDGASVYVQSLSDEPRLTYLGTRRIDARTGIEQANDYKFEIYWYENV